MFERLLEAAQRFAGCGDLLLRYRLLIFQFRDAPFIGRDHRSAAGIDDTVQQLLDLLLSSGNGLAEMLRAFGGLRQAHLPGILEHRSCDLHEPWRGLQVLEQRLELSFKLLAPDGFAAALAASCGAEIIGILA